MIRKIKLLQVSLLLILSVSVFQSCKISYSLSGVTIDPAIQTVSVQYFPNRAPLVQAQLSQFFTDEFKDKLQAQTSLTLINGVGDVDFSGEITNYETRPQAVTGNEVAALNRLTITIRVKYTNYINPDDSFDASFSRYEDYTSSQDLAAVEDDLIETIIELINEDIFNRAFVNW
jgi:hypothetical protein